MLIMSNIHGNGISYMVLKNFKLSICWIMVILLSKNRTTLTFDIESEKKLQQKFNSNIFERSFNKKTNNINLIKFMLQNSDVLKKYLDKDDFKEISFEYGYDIRDTDPFPYLIEINEKKYFNAYEVHGRKSKLIYNLNENDKSIL